MSSEIQERALADVLALRTRILGSRSEARLILDKTYTRLTLAVGWFAQAALHARFGGRLADQLRAEAVSVAAYAMFLAVAARRCDVISDILAERKWQDARWGEQNNDPFVWLAVLMEEVGEFADALYTARAMGVKPRNSAATIEAIQVAAVALAIVECLDRGVWQWGVVPEGDYKQ